MNRQTAAAATAALALTSFSGQAFAHAHLMSSDPAAGAAVSAPRAIVLRFSEKLEPKFSGADLMKADGRGVAMKSSVAAQDGKTLVATPTAPLAPGAYRVMWHAVAADGHRTTGDFSFTVR
jgi:hypothetical protein